MRNIFLLVIIFFSFSACYDSNDVQKYIRQDITFFSDCYFNYKLKEAIGYVTPDSRKWIIFLASNLSEEDIESLNMKSEPAETEIIDLSYNEYDSTGVVTLSVKNYMTFDSIDAPGHIIDEQTYKIPFVRHDNKWKIKMEGLLRNEKSNRD